MKSFKFANIEICYIEFNKEIKAKPLKGNYYKLLASCSGMLAFALNQVNTYAYDDSLKSGLPKIREAEELVLDYGFAIGRLVCVVMAIFEIIKSVKDGNAQAFWGIIIKYAIALGSLKLLPWIFDLIGGFFS
ncbi:MAG: hypothetical protein AB9856_20955 [Cellulosilyticaceae bacterium]